MRTATTLPAWSYPLVLGLVGIVLYVGNLPLGLKAGIGVESLLFLGYLIYRARQPAQASRPVAKLLPLFPGHLLLLFALSLLPNPQTALAIAWTVVPIATICYDSIARWSTPTQRLRMSLLVGLYCIIWADLFFLLERVIAFGKNVSGNVEIIVAAVFGLIGTAFIFVGVYRHWHLVNVKE